MFQSQKSFFSCIYCSYNVLTVSPLFVELTPRPAIGTFEFNLFKVQLVSDELAALISLSVRQEICHLSTAPPSSSADNSSESASSVSPPGSDDLLGQPARLDLETSPSPSQPAALPSLPTKLAHQILRGEYVKLDELLPENMRKQPKEQICWQTGGDTHASLTVSFPAATAHMHSKVVHVFSWVQASTTYATMVLRCGVYRLLIVQYVTHIPYAHALVHIHSSFFSCLSLCDTTLSCATMCS